MTARPASAPRKRKGVKQKGRSRYQRQEKLELQLDRLRMMCTGGDEYATRLFRGFTRSLRHYFQFELDAEWQQEKSR